MAPTTAEHLIRNPGGFGPGYTSITKMGERSVDTGMRFGIFKLGIGDMLRLDAGLEGALLLLDGEVTFGFAGQEVAARRGSLFDEAPSALHFAAQEEVSVKARTGCELALVQAPGAAAFAPKVFDGDTMMDNEHRGQGRLDDTAYRIVRTIFDGRNRPGAALVLGEVVNFPGRWSSYPPHHHRQPEIYHYRFTAPRGYGHGELDDDVLKIRQFDTLKITDSKDHAQASAPGYGMYYIWAIRHLPGDPYDAPEFAEEHAWLNEDDPRVWRP